MSALATGTLVFVCVFAGALLGVFLRAVPPAHHLNIDSKDVVRARSAIRWADVTSERPLNAALGQLGE